LEVDTFNVIGFLKNKGRIDGDILHVPSMSKILEEIKQASGDEITRGQLARLLDNNGIAIK
jgi:hypothetical protein